MSDHHLIFTDFKELRLRNLQPADLPLFIERGLPTCSFMHGRENVDESSLRRRFANFVQDFALEPNSEIFILEHETEGPVAQLWLHQTTNRFNGLRELWIWDITVSESCRSRGLGKRLLLFAEHRAEELGCDELWLLVSERNATAKQLYENLDFRPHARLLARSLRSSGERPRDRVVKVGCARLRRLRGEDMEALFDLWSESGHVRIRRSGREQPDRLRAFLDRTTPGGWGVWQDGKLVGAVLTQYDREKGWVERLAVQPDYRRAGLAKALVQTAIQSLLDRGAVVISALIEEGNESSQKLFEACGFKEQPRHHYYAVRVGHEY